MSDDPLKRARQALQVLGTVRPQLPALDRAKGDELIARARAAAAQDREVRREPPPERVAAASDREARREPPPEAVAEPPQVETPTMTAPAPRVEKARLDMTCGATGRPFVAICRIERAERTLVLIDSLVLQPGRGPHAPSEMLSGEYRICAVEGWACPVCKSRDEAWFCQCRAYMNALHCGGSRGQVRYCACGLREQRFFEPGEFFRVRGQSIAAAAKSGPSVEPRTPSNVPAIYRNR
jgi:hypothetical protein